MFRIHFLDVGQGDCTILQFGNGRIYLIDANETSGKVTPIDINATQTSEVYVDLSPNNVKRQQTEQIASRQTSEV